MKSKTILRVVLLVLVALGIGRWAWREFGNPESSGSVATEAAATRPDGVTVLAVHGEKRCRTCIRIGDLARDEVNRAFAAELADGRVRWDDVNYEEPANRELVTRYGLVSSTIVVTRWQDGEEQEWERLDEVWDLIGEETAYRQFIDEKVGSMLKES